MIKNSFFVSLCRFHSKEKNKLVLAGKFRENLIKENQIMIVLGKKKLSYTIEERELTASGFKTVEGLLITKQYFLWVNLPPNWEDEGHLEVINCQGSEKKRELTVSAEKLVKLSAKIPKYIEASVEEKEKYRIQGWYINDGTVKMTFIDPDGHELVPKIKYRGRPDVRRVYPENSEEEIIGFTASFKGSAPKKVKVHFESSTKQTDYIAIIRMSPMEKIVAKTNEIALKTKRYYHQFGVKETLRRAMEKLSGREAITYEEWFKRQSSNKRMLEAQREYEFPFEPKISIVVPLYKTPRKYLLELVESIRNQSYSNWELCLSDGSGSDSPIKKMLKIYEEKDERIKVIYNKDALQISENTNAALQVASGDYIAFADHDDLLAPNALYECVFALNNDLNIDVIYTDEDKIDMDAREHFQPHFKPDFNIDMLRSANYICHLFVVRKEIQHKVGLLNPEFDGAQDYDFILRCIERTSNIKHIPKVLYHWRAHKDSTAENPESKNYAFVAGEHAIQAHYDRTGIAATVMQTEYKGMYRTKYEIKGNPLVSVIIPNKDHVQDLDKCIRSLEEKNAYENMEYIIVENNSQDKHTFEYYKELETKVPKAKIVCWGGKGFNYPAINMYGVEHAKGEYILFLNNDTEIINPDCIEELLGYCARKDVGAVGARLYYEDGTIQHAGVIVGLGGVAGHAFLEYPHDAEGYFRRVVMAQDYSAVTAACMLVKKSVLDEVGGFDERYAVAFNDVDLCLKIRKAGYLIVYNPYAELLHYESKSRGYEDTEEKRARFTAEVTRFRETWEEFMEKGDPYYNPNLTLNKNDFSLAVGSNKVKR